MNAFFLLYIYNDSFVYLFLRILFIKLVFRTHKLIFMLFYWFYGTFINLVEPNVTHHEQPFVVSYVWEQQPFRGIDVVLANSSATHFVCYFLFGEKVMFSERDSLYKLFLVLVLRPWITFFPLIVWIFIKRISFYIGQSIFRNIWYERLCRMVLHWFAHIVI